MMEEHFLPWSENPDYKPFLDETDETVVALAQAGDHAALSYLLEKYKNFVRSRARTYFLIGADHEDIVQEGMIGLFKAIRDYQQEKQASFRVFAELCIKRQILTAIKSATRQKHIPLNSYVSLNHPAYGDESERTLFDTLEGRITNPEELLISQENAAGIQKKLDSFLSPFEKDALDQFMQGKSYQEIAQSLNTHVKSVDNALQRVKRKLNKYLEEQKREENQ